MEVIGMSSISYYLNVVDSDGGKVEYILDKNYTCIQK